MSKNFQLVIVDVSGIQDYIFRTNDLQHQLGASELVRRVTGEWVRKCLPNIHNVGNDLLLFDDRHIERDALDAEVIFWGGGNVVILFGDRDKSGNFVTQLSRMALLEAPGLRTTIVTRSFEWTTEESGLGTTIDEMLGDSLRRRKLSAQANGELLGLGVTADCQFTGLPAVDVGGKEKRRISAEISAKLESVPAANDRLKVEIDDAEFLLDFDQLGTKGESSYLAVIHADGNRMGKRFERVATANLKNRAYIQAVRNLSRSINSAAQNALKATVHAIRDTWQEDGKLGGVVPVRGGLLPFRPIIFGGDDVTLVCDGRLGLTVAAKYVEEFAKQTLDELESKSNPTARAGIAIVKTHFPFGRAYDLAKELARSAKGFTDDGAKSAMDWHFGVNGVVMDLEDMRKRDYVANDTKRSSLLTRPIRIDRTPTEWRNWPELATLITALGNAADYPSNKIKAFRAALRGGTRSAERFIAANFTDTPLPRISNSDATDGWIGANCAYFDAIEAMEFFVPLEPSKDSK